MRIMILEKNSGVSYFLIQRSNSFYKIAYIVNCPVELKTNFTCQTLSVAYENNILRIILYTYYLAVDNVKTCNIIIYTYVAANNQISFRIGSQFTFSKFLMMFSCFLLKLYDTS